MEQKTKIGLALSGGGARGIAHIGVIKAFEENDIEIHAVAGASAGSIVGALFAAGKTADEMLTLVRESSLFKIYKMEIPNGGLTNLTYISDKLKEVIPEDSFNALKIPLYVAVANLITGKLEILNKGSLSRIVRASSSIPFFFKPVLINGDLYVDGGVLDNLPVDPLINTMDVVIGVNVMPQYNVSHRNLQNILGIANRVFDMGVWANTRTNLNRCDLTIEPVDLHRYTIFQISKYQEIYQLGYMAGLAKAEEIKTLINKKL